MDQSIIDDDLKRGNVESAFKLWSGLYARLHAQPSQDVCLEYNRATFAFQQFFDHYYGAFPLLPIEVKIPILNKLATVFVDTSGMETQYEKVCELLKS